MSRHEERAYRVGSTKPTLASMKQQLVRLKEDLLQFKSRKPDGAMIQPLRDRIRSLEAEIAEAEASKKRDREEKSQREPGDPAEPNQGYTAIRGNQGHFPPRRR